MLYFILSFILSWVLISFIAGPFIGRAIKKLQREDEIEVLSEYDEKAIRDVEAWDVKHSKK